MKKLLCLLLAAVMLLSLCACGDKKNSATYNDAGYYEIFSVDENGETLTRADLASAGMDVFLQLDENGTGVLNWGDGDSDGLTWRDGVISDGSAEYAYALAGSMLTLDLSDSSGSLVMIFRKGTAPAAGGSFTAPAENSEKPEAPAANGGSSLVGTYQLIGIAGESEEESLTEDTLALMESLGITFRLYLKEDGTGELNMYGEAMELTWDDSSITIEGESADFTVDGNKLTISSEGTEMLVFEKISDEVDKTASGEPSADTGTDKAEAPAPAAAPTGDFTPVSGTFGDDGEYKVEILGAEPFTDYDGKNAVRFYYSFTNNSDEATSAWYPLVLMAEEDGYELTTTYARSEDDVAEYGNDDLRIEPGITILCIREYSYKPDGSNLIFSISEYGETELTAAFDPAALPGRPDPIEIAPLSDPQFYAGYESSGSEEDYSIAITGKSEIVKASSWEDYDQVIRVYFDFTNNADEAQSCWWASNCYAYQDGIQLEVGYPEDSTDSDDLFSEDVEPGQTVTCSRCWVLRSDSPVEIVCTKWDGVLCASIF